MELKSGKKSKKDIDKIVQDQINDEANEIEDNQTLQQSFDILEYGVTLDTNDFQVNESQDKDVKELQEKEAREKAKKKIEEEKAQEEIDSQNESHI